MKEMFMKRMKAISGTVKAYPESEMHLDVSDFMKLVEMAERAEYLEKEFKQYYKAACQQEASKPYELYDPTEIQALQRVASWLRIDLEKNKRTANNGSPSYVIRADKRYQSPTRVLDNDDNNTMIPHRKQKGKSK